MPDVIADAPAIMTATLWEAAIRRVIAGHEVMHKAHLDAQAATAVQGDEAAAIISELEAEAESTRRRLNSAVERLE